MGVWATALPNFIMKFQIKAKVLKVNGQPSLDFNKIEYRKALDELSEGSYVLVSKLDCIFVYI